MRQELSVIGAKRLQTQTLRDAFLANEAQANRGSPADMEKLAGFFVKPPEAAYLLNVIQGHARSARLSLTSFDVGIDRTTTRDSALPLTTIPIQLQLQGAGYPEFKEFLRRVTTSVPLLTATAFTFDPKSASVNINLAAHYLRAPDYVSGSFDPGIFDDPKFRALTLPAALPEPSAVGRENPFVSPAGLSAPE